MEGKDPFALRKTEKKLSKLKQTKQEMKNTERKEKSDPAGKTNKRISRNEKEKAKFQADKKGLQKTLENGIFF